MDVSNRKWWIRTAEGEEGPVCEDPFQDRLRAGLIPLNSMVKSNFMDAWQPLLAIVSTDETFRRPSTIPPVPPRPSSKIPNAPNMVRDEGMTAAAEDEAEREKAEP